MIANEKRILEEIERLLDEKFDGSFPTNYWENYYSDDLTSLYLKIKELIIIESTFGIDYLEKFLALYNGRRFDALEERAVFLRDFQTLKLKTDWLADRLCYELDCYSKNLDRYEAVSYSYNHIKEILLLSEKFNLVKQIIASVESLYELMLDKKWDCTPIGDRIQDISEEGTLLIEFLSNIIINQSFQN